MSCSTIDCPLCVTISLPFIIDSSPRSATIKHLSACAVWNQMKVYSTNEVSAPYGWENPPFPYLLPLPPSPHTSLLTSKGPTYGCCWIFYEFSSNKGPVLWVFAQRCLKLCPLCAKMGRSTAKLTVGSNISSSRVSSSENRFPTYKHTLVICTGMFVRS